MFSWLAVSVSNELKDLEARRLSVRQQIADNQDELDKLKQAVNRMRVELSRLQLSNQHVSEPFLKTSISDFLCRASRFHLFGLWMLR